MLCFAEHGGGWVEAGLFSCNCGGGGGLGHGGCGSCTIDVVHQLSGGVGGRGSSSILVPCCWVRLCGSKPCKQPSVGEIPIGRWCKWQVAYGRAASGVDCMQMLQRAQQLRLATVLLCAHTMCTHPHGVGHCVWCVWCLYAEPPLQAHAAVFAFPPRDPLLCCVCL